MYKLLSYFYNLLFTLWYRVPFGWLSAMGYTESNYNPRIGLHEDKISYGLYGINIGSTGSFADFKKETGRKISKAKFQSSLYLQTQVAAWYLGKRIPQLLKSFEMPTTSFYIIAVYNTGIGNVKKAHEANTVVSAITIAHNDRFHRRLKGTAYLQTGLFYSLIAFILSLPYLIKNRVTIIKAFKKLRR